MLVVATTADQVAPTRERLAALGVHETTVVDPGGDRCLIQGTSPDDADEARLASVLRADGISAVTRPDAGPRLRAWRRDSQPVVLDDRLSICLAWSEHDRKTLPGLVELGPDGFGDGTHPTTRLLLEVILTRVRGDERVLDIGCGSGVLGLGALRLGAATVVAVDLKPTAVEATRRNAVLNRLDLQLAASTDPVAEIDGTFDAILANISRAGIVDLASQLTCLLSPGGWLAVSGISPRQCSLVAGFLRPLVEVERRVDGEWAAVVFERPSGWCPSPDRAENAHRPDPDDGTE